MDDVVMVSRSEYEALVRDANILMMLKAHGVDNWIGYEDALRDYLGVE